MKLGECRKLLGQSVEQAARANRVTKACWRYWESRAKRPRGDRAYQRLLDWSGGRVTPNDFFDLTYEKYKRPHRRS